MNFLIDSASPVNESGAWPMELMVTIGKCVIATVESVFFVDSLWINE
jgi:hypothetical protein